MSTRLDCLRVLDGRETELRELRQTKLVVIGGTGFVGTWIAEMIAALNDEYHYSVKLYLVARNTDEISDAAPHLVSREDVVCIKSDVRHLRNFPMDADWVIHAAASPDVRAHASNPLDTASVIVDGTMNVVKIAERMGQLRKLLYLSSGLVCKPEPMSETGITENVVGAPLPEASFVYANSKRFAEVICSAARLQSRVPVFVARPFSFIGPYQSLETPWAQSTFLSDALAGFPIRVFGDGQVVRSYLYGSDAAYWFLKIMISGKGGDVINVGSNYGVSLQGLATRIAANFNPSPDVLLNTSSNSTGVANNLLPDTTHAQEEYDLSVVTPLDEAIRLTVRWHQLKSS